MTIERYPDGTLYSMQAIDDAFPITDRIIEDVYRNCAFGPAWRDIFYALFPNGYHPEHAREYLAKCQQGWREEKVFSYAIMSPAGDFAGTIDLKGNDPNETEVGYWCDPDHRGLMTNALNQLADTAAEAGYHKLTLYIADDNPASLGVARRCGFTHLGQRILPRWGPEWILEYFERDL